jgi:hypothetical protein
LLKLAFQRLWSRRPVIRIPFSCGSSTGALLAPNQNKMRFERGQRDQAGSLGSTLVHQRIRQSNAVNRVEVEGWFVSLDAFHAKDESARVLVF